MNSIFNLRGYAPFYHWNNEGGAAVVEEEEHEIAPVRVDETAVESEDETTFADLGLSQVLLDSITQVGFKKPTPIQAAAIPALMAGQDIIGQAQTGSGKTAAFGLPIIDMIDERDRRIQALILTPTRELAIQVSDALHNYGKHKGIQTLAIYGGQAYERQFRGLERGVHIVVGTPGRVMDHMRRNTLKLNDLRFFVLDEADEMLDMGFVDDIETILKSVPEERQTALFSATMPQRIADIANTYMRSPQRISVRGKQMTVAEVRQTSYEFPRGKKVEALVRILEAENPTSTMIFCRTKRNVDELGEALLQRGMAVETLHGDLSQVQRDRVMKKFRSGQAEILIATDVAARGLDVPEVSHVINYDVPESHETYVHRIGRTGRAGRTGEAITLVSPREFRWLRQVERTTRANIEPRRLPSQQDVNSRRREKLVQLMNKAIEDEQGYQAYLGPISDLPDDVDLQKLSAALLRLYAEETGQASLDTRGYDDLANFGGKQQVDRTPRERSDAPRGEGAPRAPRGRGGEEGMTRLFINIGHNMRVRPQDFVGAIANEANIPGRSIGAIDIHEAFSFVDVPTGDAENVMNVLNSASIKGRPVNVELAAEGAGAADGGFSRGPRADRGGFNRRPRAEGGFNRDARPGGRSSFGRGPRPEAAVRPRRDRY